MKMGQLEGTKEEIKGFFEDHGLKVSDYFQPVETNFHYLWIVLPGILLVIFLGGLSLLDSASDSQKKFIYLLSCLSSIWMATTIQLRFKNAWATGFLAATLIVLTSVAYGVITPKDVIDEVKALKKQE
ncbi:MULTISPECIES: hypothetical protein [unclassified Pseudomonas]|uniref:hypothetical protein n=1 Tax=unclassified Pseudomonas TaxID=196821 RepID=UPI00117ABAAF|nr:MULTISPECIES: hypothetical protein [unclassified Pseudomonas]